MSSQRSLRFLHPLLIRVTSSSVIVHFLFSYSSNFRQIRLLRVNRQQSFQMIESIAGCRLFLQFSRWERAALASWEVPIFNSGKYLYYPFPHECCQFWGNLIHFRWLKYFDVKYKSFLSKNNQFLQRRISIYKQIRLLTVFIWLR